MVEVNFGFLCTNLKKKQNGGFSAEDIGIRGIVSRAIPTRRRTLTAFIQMKFTASEIGPKKLGLHILDLDGNDVIEFKDVPWEPAPPPPGEFYSFDSVEFEIGHVAFPRFGEYTIIFQVDGVDLHRMLFRVSPTPEPSFS